MAPVMRWAAGLCVLVLGACADLTGFGTGSAQVTRLPLLAGEVTASGPQGYCIDPAASRPSDGFAVIAQCTIIAGQPDQAIPGGFVTIQVGTAGSSLGDEITALPALLQSEAGQTLLSQSGTAADVTVQEAGGSDTTATVRFFDRGPPPVAGLQQTEWRGFLDLSERLATVSVRGLAGAPLGTDEGLILLEQVMLALRQANAGVPFTSG